MRRTPIAHVVFPRPSSVNPVSEAAWGAVQALADSDDLDLSVLVPVPAKSTRPLQSVVRRARGVAPWPEDLEAVLATRTPRPTLVPYVPAPRRSIESATTALAVHLLRARRAARPRVIQGSFLDEGGYAASMLGRILDAPSIVVAHGSDAHAAVGDIDEPGRRARARLALRSAGKVIAASYSLAQDLTRLGVRAEVLRFTSRARQFPLAPTPPTARASRTALYVGTVSRRNGVDVLLHALARSTHADLRLRLVGPVAGDLDVMSVARSLNIDSRVELSRERPHDELSPIYASCHLVVFPRQTPEVPGALIEALLTGRPVVALDGDSTRELIDDTVGRLISTLDPIALADGIDSTLLRDFRPNDLRIKALPFTWEHEGPRLSVTVRDLLRDGGPER